MQEISIQRIILLSDSEFFYWHRNVYEFLSFSLEESTHIFKEKKEQD